MSAARPAASLARAALLAAAASGACGGEPSAPGETSPAAGPPAPVASAVRTPEPWPPGDEPWFEEVAEARGLVFLHESGASGAWLMPEIMCGGAALLDVDGDEDLDAYLVQAGAVAGPAAARRPPNQLFLNDGTGHFTDATAASGAGDRGYGMGVACGDADRDGDVDLYVTNWGPNVLLLNDGAGRFEDATARAGVGDPGWGSSAAFADLDADGQLDLYVCNYLAWVPEAELPCRNAQGARDYCNPASYQAPARDVLYRNLGDGRFRDETGASGIGAVAATGLGVTCDDFDGDGRLDVFVANDGLPNLLWRNEGGFRFRDVALLAGCALDHAGYAKAGMGVVADDLDDDGDADLLVCNLDQQTDSIFRNEGGHFRDATVRSGLAPESKAFTRFGVGALDFDHDGWLDLFQANGRVAAATSPWRADEAFAEPNLVLRGTGPLQFARLPSLDGTRQPLVETGRAAAFGDVDGDGAVDVLLVSRDAPARLLRNLAGARAPGRALRLRVLDEAGRDALGAAVTLEVGARRRTLRVRAAWGYQSSHDPVLHVGLGQERQARDVHVRWVDGTQESFGDVAAGARHVLRRGAGRP